jgi:hypothetical protein
MASLRESDLDDVGSVQRPVFEVQVGDVFAADEVIQNWD